jgi:hypothetical protein
MERCKLCKRVLDAPDDPLSKDCGGDCPYCMATIGEDPDCINPVRRIPVPKRLPFQTRRHLKKLWSGSATICVSRNWR